MCPNDPRPSGDPLSAGGPLSSGDEPQGGFRVYPLVGEPLASAPSGPPAYQPYRPQPGQAVAPAWDAPDPDPGPMRVSEPARKPKKRRSLVIAVLTALVIVPIGLMVLFVVNPNDFGGPDRAPVPGSGPAEVGGNHAGEVLITRSFDDYNLDDADFSGSNLSVVTFENASLTDARFADTIIRSGSFDNARAGDADFDGAVIATTTFQAAQLSGASFHAITGSVLDFSDATLVGASFEGARLSIVDFSGATLAGADLTGLTFLMSGDFSDAGLQGARLGGADLRAANLEGADLAGATYDDATQWPAGFDIPDTAVKVD
jgi:hypothetical protein